MEKIKYVCVVDTLYSLSLYLLYQSYDKYDETLFFVGNVIPESVSSKLRHVFRIDYKKKTFFMKKNLLIFQLQIAKYGNILKKATIYAQDHLAFSGLVIGSNKYTLLEDAPHIFTIYKTISFMNPSPFVSLREKIRNSIFLKSFGDGILGRNKQCVSVVYTCPEDSKSDLLKNKESILVDLNKMWDESNIEKKKFLFGLFGIDDKLLNVFMQNRVILFSQPLLEDCKLSEDEIIAIYAPYIEKYKNEGVIIKPHPRDKFNYEKHFGVPIMKINAPMQILSAMGLSFKTAITICSTAVSSMGSDCEIIWIGASVNKKILEVYGDLKCPISCKQNTII